MAARTWGQHATPTSFGAQLAAWGWPLLDALKALPALRRDCLWVSLSGAAGTASELGPDPAALRADLAKRLALQDPGRSWHSDRSAILSIAGWMSRVTMALGKIGEDSTLAVQTGIDEMTLGETGASSTMPQKQNPVGPSAMVALAHHSQGLFATLQGAALHRQQRDGAALFTEWLSLPQLGMGTASALGQARILIDVLAPRADTMAQTLATSGGFILAERLSFELAKSMRRPDAQDEVKRLAALARNSGQSLAQVTQEAHPSLPADLFDPTTALGAAPQEAARFAEAAQAFR
jgi:3-carboxy-cis,cis-muconate cycloisomerase